MSASDKAFVGSIPDIYDSYLVPLIFHPYAADLAQRAAETAPKQVLETAAGSGVVPRALAPLLAPDARYVVTDLNPPMLDRAKRQQSADARIVWRQADALSLPFGERAFDVVLCQFGAMFFPDRVAGYREARRVLKPGGRFLCVVWDRIEDNPFSQLVTEAAAEIFPKDPPRFLARTPHGYHDREQIARDVRAAGFSTVEISTVTKEGKAPGPSHPAIGFAQGCPLRLEIEERDATKLEAVTELATEMIAKSYGRGAIAGKIQAIVIEART
jgi:ubiquinone/menaquinone biosynthesis C-methylase UbiE